MTRVIKKLKEHSNLNSNNLKRYNVMNLNWKTQFRTFRDVTAKLPEVVLNVKENN